MSESDIPPSVLGEPGQPGEPGAPPPTAKGGDGGTGGAGGVGLPGQRGRKGEHGDAGRDGINSVSPTFISSGTAKLIALTALLFLVVIGLSLVVTLRSQSADERTISFLRDQLSARRAEHEEIFADRVIEQAVEDCRDLYVEDIEFARIARDIEQGDLLATAVLIPLDTPADERLAIQREAVDALIVKDIMLSEAASMFRNYIATDPAPGECPHPDSP